MRAWQIIRAAHKYNLILFLANVWWCKLFNLVFFWQKQLEFNSKEQALRMFLQNMGAIYIKFGQFLSVRQDLITDQLAQELQLLQDEVPAMSWSEAETVLIKSFGQEYQKLFNSFDQTAFAAASIAQVHHAVSSKGQTCVVKIVRPKLAKAIKQDLKLARKIANFLLLIYPQSSRLRLLEVIEDYQKVILDELDLNKEAASMSQVKRNFIGNPALYVPEVDWQRSSSTVLTMEHISGVHINQIDLLKKNNIDLKVLAERGVEIFFTQVFDHNFFHADMHPGNIFIDIKDPTNPSYIAVDFGIMGSLTDDDQYYLAISLKAFFNNDYSELAKAYISSGWVNPNTSSIELEAAFRTVLEPYINKPIQEISLANILIKLFKISGNFGMEIQPQLVLLDKTLLYIEGLGRQIYPQLDLWNTAKPFIEKWLSKKFGFRSFLDKSKNNFEQFVSTLPEKPIQIDKLLTNLNNGKLSIKYQNPEIEKSLTAIKKNQKKLRHSVLAGFLLLAAVVLLGQQQYWLASLFLALSFWLFIKG